MCKEEMEQETNIDHSPVENNGGETHQIAKKKRMVIEVCIYVIALFFVAVIVPKYLLQRTIVIGDSMENTLYDGENIWVEKISRHFDHLKRFDIIVFYPYGRENKEYFIKRIIGLPGESVQIMDDTIFINGIRLSENFGKDPITYQGIAAEELTLADDEYFVLGDNRTVSLDSRYSNIGPIKKKNIGGRAILRIWPLSRFGLID